MNIETILLRHQDPTFPEVTLQYMTHLVNHQNHIFQKALFKREKKAAMGLLLPLKSTYQMKLNRERYQKEMNLVTKI